MLWFNGKSYKFWTQHILLHNSILSMIPSQSTRKIGTTELKRIVRKYWGYNVVDYRNHPYTKTQISSAVTGLCKVILNLGKNSPILFKIRTNFLLTPEDNTASSTCEQLKKYLDMCRYRSFFLVSEMVIILIIKLVQSSDISTLRP